MYKIRSLFFLIGIGLALVACGAQTNKTLKIGTSSHIDVLTPNTQFYKDRMPLGWVVEGASLHDLFTTHTELPSIYMTRKEAKSGVHVQTGHKDFILARYTQANLLVSPYLIWDWYISEHKEEHHPVRLLIGFYGGNPESPPLESTELIWKGKGLPPFDRLLAIGFDDMALKRGNIYDMGKVKYYAQRGGIENTNMWFQEAADLNRLYARSWPNDKIGNVMINFVAIASQSLHGQGGITFSSIQLSR
jgi:hypothetical protein